MKQLQCPMVHLNGSGKDRLIEDLNDAFVAIDGAMTVLQKASPNGRDYYPLGPAVMERAIKEHRSRALKLQAVKDELFAMIEAIEDGKTTVEFKERKSDE